MQKIFLFLSLFINVAAVAQTPLPVQCTDLKEKLLLVQKSFSTIEAMKKDSIPSLFKDTWTTDFMMCGVKAIVRITQGGNREELLFKYEKNFKATDAEVEKFADKVRNEISGVFSKTFLERYERNEGDEYAAPSHNYTWKVNGSGFGPAKKSIELEYPYLGSHLAIRFIFDKSVKN